MKKPALHPLILHYLVTHTIHEVRAQQFEEAVAYAKGNVAAAARQLGCTRRSVYMARGRSKG